MDNMKKWVDGVIASPYRIAIPIMTHPGIEFLDKTVKEAVTDAKVHFEAIRALDDTYMSGGCTTIMDLTVEAEAFGAEVVFPENEVPSVVGRLVYDAESIRNLAIPSLDKGRIPEFLKASRLTVESIRTKPVFGGVIGPFSLAGRLFDISELMITCYTEPEVAKELLEKCSKFLLEYCLEMKKQGIQGILIAEPVAGLLPSDGCEEFSSRYIKPIVDAVQDESFIILLHNCGNKGHCTDAMLSTGAAGYHFGNEMDMVLALEQCPSDVLVMGNLNPVGLFKHSTAQQVKQVTLDLLEKTKNYPNFILSSGCDIPPHIPLENIEAFYEALNEFNSNI